MLLVCGGDSDPNLHCLLATLQRRRQPHRALLAGATHHPTLEWDLTTNRLRLEGRAVAPSAIFLRYDVFTNLNDQQPSSAYRANAWYTTLQAWQLANPRVRAFNGAFGGHVFKPHILRLAKAAGLAIPTTVVTNHLDRLARWQAREELIAKPVAGGDYCQKLGPLLQDTARRGTAAAAPAIVQTCLVPPEWRVYRIGRSFHAFTVEADALDYRTTQRCVVHPEPTVPRGLVAGLRKLTDRLGLDFMAADFKACPQTGRLLFLEVNSGPMFSAFDAAGHGCLTDAMAEWLGR